MFLRLPPRSSTIRPLHLFKLTIITTLLRHSIWMDDGCGSQIQWCGTCNSTRARSFVGHATPHSGTERRTRTAKSKTFLGLAKRTTYQCYLLDTPINKKMILVIPKKKRSAHTPHARSVLRTHTPVRLRSTTVYSTRGFN
jgi:hypothetical protein